MAPRKITVNAVIRVVRFPDDSIKAFVNEDYYGIILISHVIGDRHYYFESEAYHLSQWCKDNGCDYVDKEIEITEDVEFPDDAK